MISLSEVAREVFYSLLRYNPRLQWDDTLALAIRSYFYPEQGYRWTIEVHPATLGEDFARMWVRTVIEKSETLKREVIKFRRIYVTASSDPSLLSIKRRIVITIVLTSP